MPKAKGQNKGQKGISLAENIIALFLIGVIGFILFQSVDTLRGIARTTKQTTAYHIASRKIEEIRNTEFENLPESGSFTDPKLSSLPEGSAFLTVSDYDGETTIKQLTVTISWIEEQIPREVKLDTLISEEGLHKK